MRYASGGSAPLGIQIGQVGIELNGLDTRVHRLDPRSSVRWLDVDYPEVLELRERLLPARAGDYRMIGASVTDHAWLDAVPDDRPTVAVFEGLSMYLRKEDGKRLIQRITGRFPSGQLPRSAPRRFFVAPSDPSTSPEGRTAYDTATGMRRAEARCRCA